MAKYPGGNNAQVTGRTLDDLRDLVQAMHKSRVEFNKWTWRLNLKPTELHKEHMVYTPEYTTVWKSLMDDCFGKGCQRGFFCDIKDLFTPVRARIVSNEMIKKSLNEAAKRVVTETVVSGTGVKTVVTTQGLRYKLIDDISKEPLCARLLEKLQTKLMEYHGVDSTDGISVEASYIMTVLGHDPQIPHLDFPREHFDMRRISVLKSLESESEKKDECSNEFVKAYNRVVPWLAFFPVTPEGMYLDVWKAEKTWEAYKNKMGYRVFIPFKKVLIMRSDVLHAGNISSTFVPRQVGGGSPRYHFYIFKHLDGNALRSAGSWIAPRDNQNDYLHIFNNNI
jgi:hypothetical protein